MATKQVGYKEPAGYFNAAMRKAARDWDKAHKDDGKAQKKTDAKKTKK